MKKAGFVFEKKALVSWAFFLLIMIVLFRMKDTAISILSNVEPPVKMMVVNAVHLKAKEDSIPLQTYGVVKSFSHIYLTSKSAGHIDLKDHHVGYAFKKGDILATISDEAVLSGLKAAEDDVIQKQQDYETSKKLHAKSYQSKDDLLKATSALTQAKHTLDQAKKQAQYLSITAPFDGVIDSLPIDNGQWVEPTMQVIGISKSPSKKVRFDVAYDQKDKISVDHKAIVKSPKGDDLKAKVIAISSNADSKTRTFEGYLEILENTSIPGNTVLDIKILPDPQDVFQVSASTLVLSDEEERKLGVWTVKDNHVTFQPVNLLSMNNEIATIEAFEDEATIVTFGAGFLSEGSLVKVVLS